MRTKIKESDIRMKSELTECNRSGMIDTVEEQTNELEDQIEELFQKEGRKDK